ncbi:LT_GEWL domain containing protein [uncultured Caudovirales phage]|uniref:LT_GEWL domain containing protein n=1 Tax=uncultured Caudovirales phage TaxID=2100421 RepID=A0A6J5LJL4_9CAUD|nr:LT_GEWL domain containing protein [uncultured Caudovirales phage]
MANNPFLDSNQFEKITEDEALKATRLAPIPAPTIRAPKAAPTRDDVMRRAQELDIDPNLALSFFAQESSGNWNSKNSPKGARGGMQVMPDTYKRMMGTDAGQDDPYQNMEAGLRYIAYGQKTLNTRNPELLAAGYHAGYDRKDLKEGRIPNTSDGLIKTSDYAKSVARRAGGKSALDELNKDEPGRYESISPSQAMLDAEEPGRYEQITNPRELARYSDTAYFTPDGVAKSDGLDKAAGSQQKAIDDKPLLKYFSEKATTGFGDMLESLKTAQWTLGVGEDDATYANTLANKLAEMAKRPKTTGEMENDAAFKAVSDANGVKDTTIASLKAIGTAITNPKATMGEVVQQASNSLPTMAGGIAGAGAGAAAGAPIGGVGAIPGAIVGGRLGMAAGTTISEGAGQVEELIQNRLAEAKVPPTAQNILAIISNPEFKAEAMKQGAAKGLTIAAVDQLTMGLAGKIITAPAKKLAIKELESKGVDVATAAAKKAALASPAGQAALKAATPSLGAKIGAGAAAVGLDATGETVGDYAGSIAADGHGDFGDSLRGGVMSLGQSGVSVATGAAIENAKMAAAAANAKINTVPNTPSKADGPLARATEDAASKPERATVTTPQGTVSGDVVGKSADGGVQIVSDDGEVLTFNTGEAGIKIDDPISPLTAALENAAEQHSAQSAVTPVIADAPMPSLESQQPAIEPVQSIADMSPAQLQERLDYIANQAKANGGMDKRLSEHKAQVQSELDSRQPSGVTNAQTAETKQAEAKQPAQTIEQPKADKGGFIDGTDGYRIRIGQHKKGSNLLDPAADIGALTYEIRKGSEDTNPLTMVVTKDGKLVAAKSVLTDNASNGTAWVPPNQSAADAVRALLEKRAKTSIGSAERKAVDAEIASAVEASKAPAPTKTAKLTKAEEEHLFGVPAKREKALERIAAGKAWFNDGVKAKDFITKNGLKDTHQTAKGKGGRWDVVAKEAAKAEPTNAELMKAAKDSGRLEVINVGGTKSAAPSRQERIDSILKNGGNVVGDELRMANGQAMMKLTEDELSAVPNDKRDSKEAIKSRLDAVYGKGTQNGNDTSTNGKPASTEKVVSSQEAKPAEAATVQPNAAKEEVTTPQSVNSALDSDMQKQKTRIKRLRTAANAGGMTLEQKLEAGRKADDAEKTLRKMRLSRFDAEDAAAAVASGDVNAFAPHADIFPSAAKVISEASKNAPVSPDTKEQGHTHEIVGRNQDGKLLVKDKNGVRSYVESGIRISEPVSIRPTRDGVQSSIDRRPDEFKTADELAKNSSVTDTIKSAVSVDHLSNDQLDQVAGIFGVEKPKETYGSKNKLVTTDRAADIRAKLKSKLNGSQLNSGIDPEVLALGAELSVFHIEAGVRKFADFAKAISADLDIPLDRLRKYLRGWYNGARDMMEDANVSIDGMDDADAVRKAMSDMPTENKEPTKESINDTKGNDADYVEPLDNELPTGNPELATDLAPKPSESVRDPNTNGDGQPIRDGSKRRTGVGRGEKPILHGATSEIRPIDNGPITRDTDAPNQLTGGGNGNFSITDADEIGVGSKGQKLRNNMDAIRTLRKVQKENRAATNQEQATMAKFVGWGGLRELIDVKTTGKQWLDARAELLGKNGNAPLLVGGDTGEDWISLQRSTTAAHFTAPEVVKAMWAAAEHFGFNGGRALEPTSGIGNFIGLQPQHLAASTKWHGAELDTITGQMAKLIYPEAAIHAGTGFESVPFAKGAFDLAIGNPPFGSLTIQSDVPAYSHIPKMKIHNFIIAKTGEHLRPGGVMGMVVTHRFLDTANPEARQHLASDFKFLGALRLPNDAFKANAGTDVVTDIVFMQKLREGEKSSNNSWLDTDGKITVDGEEMRVNKYFEANPNHILGKSAMDGSMYGAARGEKEYTVHSDGRDIAKSIEDIINGDWATLKDVSKPSNADQDVAAVMLTQSKMPVGGVMLDESGKIMKREMDDSAGNAVVKEVTPDTLWKSGAEQWQNIKTVVLGLKSANLKDNLDALTIIKEVTSIAYSAKGEKKPKPSKAEAAVYDLMDAIDSPNFKWKYDAQLAEIDAALSRRKLGDKGYKSLNGLLGLRAAALKLIESEMKNGSDMDVLRKELNDKYDDFVAKNGHISDPANTSLLDGDVGVESGLEIDFKPKGSNSKASARKADIFTQRVNFPYKEITSAKNAHDGLQISMSERGRLDIGYIAGLVGDSKENVIKELSTGDNPSIFFNPDTSEYEDADGYLSGNVKLKLEKAKSAGLKQNIKSLELVQPKPKTKDNVKPNIRGSWIPEAVFEQFLTDIGVQNARVNIIASQGMILAQQSQLNETEFGAQFKSSIKSIIDIFNSASSGKPINIWTESPDGKRVKNESSTKEVNLIVERMSKVFGEWAYSNDDRVQSIVDAFNQKMNTHIPRKFDGNKYLKTVGANPSIVLRTTQKNAAWRMVQSSSVLLDHVVGAGKTFTIITGVKERKRLGLSRKPLIIVPNHLVTQWAKDFYALYPSAKILAATPDDFSVKNRRRMFSRIATGDYDSVIIGHSSMNFIPSPMKDQERIINENITELQEVLNEMRSKKESSRTITQIQERLQKYKEKLKDLMSSKKDDLGIDLESMGIDYVAVDEMHEFKNLEYSSAGERVVGMNDPKGSKKAFDLYIKLRGVQARGGAVTGATGTPVSNSLVELYTMMKYLAHKDLTERGQSNFDSWSGAYARTETKLEYTATQKLKPRRVLAGLNNLSALKQIYESFADVISMDDLKRIYSEDVEVKNKKNGTKENTAFPVPKVQGGKRVLDAGPITEAQSLYMDYLVARMGAIEANKGNKLYASIDNPLFVLTDARKMSLDIRIVDPMAPRDENGKVARAGARIKSIYDKWSEHKGAQMVFCDLSTPAKNAVKEAKSLIKDSLEKILGDAESKRVKHRVEAQGDYIKQWRYIESLANDIIDNPQTAQEVADKTAEYMASLEDVDAIMTTADVGFSVYDDLKGVLIDSGIPEREIAFIHDYNTPEQKSKLFQEVNDGEIRVLLGSSAKMGAGTNAQKRLVALHHMDAPWRPSDVEQREGRIIRQGNLFYSAVHDFEVEKLPKDILASQKRLKEQNPNGFEVSISAYSTNGTSDAVMWQVLERKAKAIEEFRKSEMDSTDEDEGDANQYAEFMAQSTGNPVFKLKMEAEREVDSLDAETRGLVLSKSQAKNFMASYDRNMAKGKSLVDMAAKANADSIVVGEESGTASEFESAMAEAEAKHTEDYAKYLSKKDEANKKLDEWTATPEEDRGEKPKMPSAPSSPSILSKSVLDKSGYARSVKAALERATLLGVYEFKVGNIDLKIRKSVVQEAFWIMEIHNGGDWQRYDASAAVSAETSSKLATSLTPEALMREVRLIGNFGKETVRSLESQRDIKEKLANREIGTDKLKEAQNIATWYRAQVAFAEQQADEARGERLNKYISRDGIRNLSQFSSDVKEPKLVQFDGKEYSLTGYVSKGAFKYAQAVDARGGEYLILLDSKDQPEGIMAKPEGIDYSGIKKVETKPDDGDVKFNRKESPIWRSALGDNIEVMNVKAQPTHGWMQSIQGLIKNGKVKADEVEWSGVTDWLKLQEGQGKVTKEQVMDYLNGNGVQVQDVTLDDHGGEWAVYNGFNSQYFDSRDEANNYAKANGISIDSESVFKATASDNESKYSQYQLAGGENYREVLLTLPSKQERAFQWEWFDPSTQESKKFETRDAALLDKPLGAIVQKVQVSEKNPNYKSSHWDQPNVLAHIRLNDRTDAEGSRVLFVEEVQSDWGQDGKKKGFATERTRIPYKAEKEGNYWRVEDQNGQFMSNVVEFKESDTAADILAEVARRVASGDVGRIANDNRVPLAPFITHTDKWLTLALKRIVKLAVDEGYDKVAFINGEQSADRYDLSKSVEEISYNKNDQILRVITIDGKVAINEKTSPEKLPDVIGKEVADKIAKDNGTFVRMTGLDLKIGGSGMKAFYDKIVPSAANSLLKKLGGEKMESIRFADGESGANGVYQNAGQSNSWQIDGSDEIYKTEALATAALMAQRGNGQQGFTITDKMREQAADGLPMFNKTEYDASHEAKNQEAPITDSQSKADIERLEKMVDKAEKGATAQEDKPYAAVRLRDAEILSKIARALGARVVGFRTSYANRKKYGFFNGVTAKSHTSPIYINERSTRPHLAILGHEFAHRLAATNPELYRRFVAAIAPYVNADKYQSEFVNSAVAKEVSSDHAKLEEFVGEVLSDAFMDGNFWRHIAQHSNKLLQQVYNFVMDLLGKITAQVPYTKQAAPYLTDYAKVMQIASEVMAEYGMNAKQVSGLEGLADTKFAKTDTPDFNRKEPEGLTPPEQGFLRRVQAAIQDGQNRVLEVQNNIEKLTGKKLPEYANHYHAETSRPGRVAARQEDMQDKLTEPLMTKLAKSGHTPEQLNELLHAMHAKERNEVVAKVNPLHDPKSDKYAGVQGSGMNDDVAEKILKKYEGNKELHKLASDARAISKQTLELKLAYGMITKERFDGLTAAYSHYVPLKGDGEYGPKIKRAMGHGSRDEQILENISRDYAQAVTTGEKNLARQPLLQMALENPDEALWTVGVPPKGRYVAGESYDVHTTDGTIVQFTSEIDAQQFAEAQNIRTPIEKVSEGVRTYVKPLQDNEILIYVEGRAVRMQINGDETLARQLRPLNKDQMNVVLEGMRKANRYFSAIYTGKNPYFIPRNMIRDLFTGTINITGNEGAGMAAASLMRYPSAFKAMTQWAATKQAPNSKMGRYLNEYRDHGGKTGASWMSDLEQHGKTLTRMFEDAYGVGGYIKDGRYGKASWIAARKTLSKAGHTIEIINQGAENAMRLALFASMREKGVAPGEAARAAKAVTVNFDRRGTETSTLGALYLFLNPAIQGTANLAHTLFSGKHKYQAWSAVGMLASLGAYMAFSGMDDDKDKWLGYNWSERSKNLIWNVGGYQIKAPMSQEYAPFYALGIAMAEASRGESTIAAAGRLMASFLDAYVPLKGAYDYDSNNHALDLAMSTVPTIGRAPLEVAVNRNSFGNPIMPENPFNKNQPNNMKMTRATKGTVFDSAAQGIAQAGEALGAKRYENGISKISPETLKYMWRTYTGGLGQVFADTVSIGSMAAQDAGSMEVTDMPFIKDFVKNDTTRTVRGRFYDMVDDMRLKQDAYKEAKKAGDFDEMEKMDTVSKSEMRKLTHFSKMASKVRDDIDDVMQDKSLKLSDKRAKLKALEADEEQIYRDALESLK